MKDKIVTMWKNKKIRAVALVFAMVLVAGAVIVPSALKAKAAEIAANQVADGMLDVKMQIQEVSGSLNMRLVSSVNGLGYSKVGFEVSFDANNDGAFDNATEKVVFDTTTVLERINASKTGVTYKYSPKVIDTDSEYFVTGTLTAINQQKLAHDFYVRAFVVSLDGNTTTYGTGRYFNIQDARSNSIINIPVKDVNGTLTAGSTVDVTVANVTSTATVEANRDGYAHLNVAVPAGATVTATQSANKTLLPSASKIAVANTSLSAVYRNLESAYANKNAGDDSWYQVDPNASAFIIATDADLFGFSSVSQETDDFNGQKVYQVADITVNEGKATSTGFTVASGTTVKPWTPVSPNTKPFAGTFDGQNHSISGLSVGTSGSSEVVGLFGVIADGTVKNLKIANSYFAGKNQIGSIAGVASQATFENINVNTHIYASGGYVGGFFGQQVTGALTLTDCTVRGTVTSAAEIAGGFGGRIENASTTISLTRCTNEATVSVTGTQAGGFIGRMANSFATFTNSTNKGSVHATGTQVAGFVGGHHNGGSINISDSLNQGAISSNGAYVGGFVAYTGGTSVSITDSINEGTVTGTELVGGFLGGPGNTISVTGCQNKADITGSSNGVGGIVGQMGGGTLTITGSSNSGTVKASGNGIGGLVGKTYGNTTIDNGTNTGTVGTLGSGRCTGGIVGFAEAGSTLEVKNSSNKGAVSGNDVIGGIVGTANIGITVTDCTNENTVTAKVNPAGGIFGYAIKGTTSLTRCENKSTVVAPKIVGGMIGQVDAAATVSFTSCTNSGAIEGAQHSVGGFVGDAWGAVTITGGLNTGKVGCTSNSAGGFIGYVRAANAAGASISNSKNKGDFVGPSAMAGFVGNAQRTVSFTNCQNEGNYNGTGSNIGGFVGFSNVKIQIDTGINQGTITSTAGQIGGFVGCNDLGGIEFTNSRNEAAITANAAVVGGFVGIVKDSVTITNSKNLAAVTGSGDQVGGMIGTMKKDKNASLTLAIQKSSNEGKITATGGNTAGFIGYSENLPTMAISESQNIGQIHNNGTGTNYGGFLGWMNGGAVTIENCLNAGEITSSANNCGGFVGTMGGSATINKSLNVGVITNTAQYAQVGSFIGNAPGTWTITNSYASKESCVNYLYQYKDSTTQWLKDNTIQVSAANLTGAAAETNAPNLDWSKWQATDGFPQLKCFVDPQ